MKKVLCLIISIIISTLTFTACESQNFQTDETNPNILDISEFEVREVDTERIPIDIEFEIGVITPIKNILIDNYLYCQCIRNHSKEENTYYGDLILDSIIYKFDLNGNLIDSYEVPTKEPFTNNNNKLKFFCDGYILTTDANFNTIESVDLDMRSFEDWRSVPIFDKKGNNIIFADSKHNFKLYNIKNKEIYSIDYKRFKNNRDIYVFELDNNNYMFIDAGDNEKCYMYKCNFNNNQIKKVYFTTNFKHHTAFLHDHFIDSHGQIKKIINNDRYRIYSNFDNYFLGVSKYGQKDIIGNIDKKTINIINKKDNENDRSFEFLKEDLFFYCYEDRKDNIVKTCYIKINH